MIFKNLSGESYSGIRALMDLSMCVKIYQQAFWRRYRETVAELTSNLT
jgi:hypothetical protein